MPRHYNEANLPQEVRKRVGKSHDRQVYAESGTFDRLILVLNGRAPALPTLVVVGGGAATLVAPGKRKAGTTLGSMALIWLALQRD